MKVKVQDVDIECPDKPWMVALVQRMTFMQAWTLHRLQQQPKKWPGHTNIPEYCIYMGSADTSDGPTDFYHYEPSPASYPQYSTAIVFGNEPGDYRSGWPELAVKHDYYHEQVKREFRCGFLTLDDLARVGMAALDVGKESSDTIRPMRSNFRLGPELDDEVDEPCKAEQAEPKCDDWKWFGWFVTFWLLFLEAVVFGGIGGAQWLVGERTPDTWVFLIVAGVATAVCAWWTCKNPMLPRRRA